MRLGIYSDGDLNGTMPKPKLLRAVEPKTYPALIFASTWMFRNIWKWWINFLMPDSYNDTFDRSTYFNDPSFQSADLSGFAWCKLDCGEQSQLSTTSMCGDNTQNGPSTVDRAGGVGVVCCSPPVQYTVWARGKASGGSGKSVVCRFRIFHCLVFASVGAYYTSSIAYDSMNVITLGIQN